MPDLKAPPTALGDPEYLPRVTVDERRELGRGLRELTPPEALASWSAPRRRTDPLEVLARQARQRDPELVPLRYGRMLLSPFAFFRGAAAIMAADLATTPVGGLRAQLCGDAHLANFGLFDTPQRALLFGINDFDETLPGPVEWDVKRLTTSVEVAARDLGMPAGQREHAVLATARAYRKGLRELARMSNLEVWYTRLTAEGLQQRMRARSDGQAEAEVRKRVRRAMQKDSLHAFERLTTPVDGQPRFLSDPPVLVPVEDLLHGEQRQRYARVVRSFLHQYRDSLPPERRLLLESYRFVDMARKVVGVGSVGTRCWVVLMHGRDGGDPLLLQLKEAQQSVLAPYAGETTYETQGRRVVEGQRLIQFASDSLLGWYTLEGFDGLPHDFYVRQLWDGKASISIAGLSAKGLAAYGECCGWTLARAHARSGDRVALAAYVGKGPAFEEAMASFATAYADTNEDDYARLEHAVATGRLQADAGPPRG